MKTIGEQLKDLRKKSGLTQAEFAEKVGLSTANKGQVIADLESGRANASIKTLNRICEAFNKRLSIRILNK